MIESTVTRTIAEPTSRRELLRRLAVVGLVAASSTALLPDHGAAKSKSKRHGAQHHGSPQRQRSDTTTTSHKRHRERPREEPQPADAKAIPQGADHAGRATSDSVTRATMPCTIYGPDGKPFPILSIQKSGSTGYVSIRAEARLSADIAKQIQATNPTYRYHFQFNLWEWDGVSDDWVWKGLDQLTASDLVKRGSVYYARGTGNPTFDWATLRSYGTDFYMGVHLFSTPINEPNKRIAVATAKESNYQYI